MNNQQYIDNLIEKSRKAQKAIENYTQEQVDALVKAMGKVIYDNGDMLSREAIEETGMGTFESKSLKHTLTANLWNYMKDKKSVGVIDDDPVNGIVTLAKPMGVVACLSPSTNPTYTPAINGMQAVKSRNSMIVSPHPKSKKCTAHAVKLMSDAIVELGGPADLIQTIEEPSMELSGLLMKSADVIIATGGAAMVKAAYSSGKPSLGVGPGNIQTIIDEDYDNIDLAVQLMIMNRAFDNGIPCTGDQTVFIPKSKEEVILNKFKAAGSYIVKDEKVIENMRNKFFKDGRINLDIVGKTANEVAEYVGLDIPENTPTLLVEITKYGAEEILSKEIMAPVSKYIVYDKFEDGVAMAKANLLNEGAGHSSVIFSNNKEKVEYFAEQLPVSRIMVNQMGADAAGGSYANSLAPTCTVGCGTWGNNSYTDNLSYKNLLNYTRIAYTLDNPINPSYEETWG